MHDLGPLFVLPVPLPAMLSGCSLRSVRYSGHPAAARVRYIRGPVDGSVPLHGFRLARTPPKHANFFQPVPQNISAASSTGKRQGSRCSVDPVVRPPIAVTAVHTQILSPGEFRANLVLCCPTHRI